MDGGMQRRTGGGMFLAISVGLAGLGACSGDDGVVRAGAWEFKVDTAPSGPAGAGPAAWLRGTGREGPQGKEATVASILSFDCRADHTGATIMTTQALRQGTTEAEVSVGGDQTHTLAGFAGTTQTGGQVVLTAPLDSVLDLVRGHDSVTVQYADGAGSSKTTAVFPLAGLDSLRERFLAACGGRPGK